MSMREWMCVNSEYKPCSSQEEKFTLELSSIKDKQQVCSLCVRDKLNLMW